MKTKTTSDILNASCEQTQIVKGGVDLNQQWVKQEDFMDKVCMIEYLNAKIEAANEILEKYTPRMVGWKLAKRVRCVLCTIEDCSTKGSVEPDECLLINSEQNTKEKK